MADVKLPKLKFISNGVLLFVGFRYYSHLGLAENNGKYWHRVKKKIVQNFAHRVRSKRRKSTK